MRRQSPTVAAVLLLLGLHAVAQERPAHAPTPPMGWNSWNAFDADIDASKLRAIADAMVSSGMRDAGYVYLVLDDGWMAKERDAAGRPVADPSKTASDDSACRTRTSSRTISSGTAAR